MGRTLSSLAEVEREIAADQDAELAELRRKAA
jgi:hypothetical protein